MVEALAVEMGQRARWNNATAEEEEGETPPLLLPPPPPPVRRPRQPTPDHPPYCWMIGEAIDALGQHGGSAVDEISSFIRTRHPGVPAAHDRFLRHYLARHVADGFFVCTAPGRYARSPSEATRVEPPVVQVKRGRGRPRKNSSSSTPPAVKKDGNAGSAPGRYARSPSGAAVVEDLMELAVASPSEAARVEPPEVQVKRVRGRPRKDGLSSTPPVVKKDGNAESVPGRYARSPSEAAAVEALVEPAVAGPFEAARVEPPVVQVKRGRGRPRKDGSSSTPPAVKKGGNAGSAPPKRRERPRGVAQLAASGGSVPSSSVADKNGSQATASAPRRRRPSSSVADKNGSQATASAPRRRRPSSSVADKNGSQATASAPRRRRRLRKLAANALATDNEKSRNDAPSTTCKEHGRSLELALVVVGDCSAATPTVDGNVCGEAPPSMFVDSDQPCELALVTATDVAAGDGPLLVADKTNGNETQSGKYKCRRLRQPRKAVPMVIAGQGSVPASAAGKKARGKTLSAKPKAKGRRQRKLDLVATGSHSDPTSVTGKKAGNVGAIATLKLTPVTAGGGNGTPSVAHGQPSRLYPVTAGEIPDDPSSCLLALPAVASA